MNIDGLPHLHDTQAPDRRWPLAPGVWPLLSVHSKILWQAERAISNGQLRELPRFHIRPIDVVVFHGPSLAYAWEISSRGRFRAYMPSALIPTRLRYPAMPLA